MKKYLRQLTHPLIIALFGLTTSPSLMAKTFETSLWHTKNGAQVIFYQAMEVPMIDISVAFTAGSAYDGPAFGISALTTKLLNQGSRGININAMAKQIAATGAQFEATSNKDMVVLNLKSLAAPNNLKKATELFSTLISHPDFPVA